MTRVVQFLESKLFEAFAEEWDPERPTRAEIVGDGNRIGLHFFAKRRDGSWTLVHDEPAIHLATETDAADLLARGLSIFLMKHPGWPR